MAHVEPTPYLILRLVKAVEVANEASLAAKPYAQHPLPWSPRSGKRVFRR